MGDKLPAERFIADEIWNECNELLAQDNFSARGIMQQMNVKMVGTTAVSYTHLDVYKRQELIRRCEG